MSKPNLPYPPVVLLVLDGWGELPPSPANAIRMAKTPCWDELWSKYPHVLLEASGIEVGLPEGQMGNSEVGHLTLGAGRVLDQDLTRISKAIAQGDLLQNTVLQETFTLVKKNNKCIHLMGLVSHGGVHSHDSHLHALIEAAMSSQCPHIYIHAFLDGRDTPPRSASAALLKLEALCQKQNVFIGSISGRYFAMDRDKRWERTEKVYRLLSEGHGEYLFNSATEALEAAYARDESDEFVQPTRIEMPKDPLMGKPLLADGDAVIFFNFRADRARQLSEALVNPNFTGFHRKVWHRLGRFLSFTEYLPNLTPWVIFPSKTPEHLLGSYLAEQGFTQLRLAETEKYAHVTFFFNGGSEKPLPGEERLLIPSPKITTYDLKPEMSLAALNQALIKAIQSQQYDFILCNFANADMVGHTGQLQPTIAAIEAIDRALSQLVPAILAQKGLLFITADHGNAECLFDETTQQVHTAHTLSPVPLICISPKGDPIDVKQTKGTLKDVAPSLLSLMGLPIPPEMTGSPLFFGADIGKDFWR